MRLFEAICLGGMFLGLSEAVPGGLWAATPVLKVVEKAAPATVSAAVGETLQATALQVTKEEKPIYEIWMRNGLKLPAPPESSAKGLDALKETTLLGVIVVHGAQRDYRDDEVAAGTYTMRFAFQPQDGDHLGSSEYVYYAVLVPAKNDVKPEGITKYGALMKASGKETATGHPMVLSIRPVTSDEKEIPVIVQPAAGHRSLRVKVPVIVNGLAEQSFLIFDLVFEGKGNS